MSVLALLAATAASGDAALASDLGTAETRSDLPAVSGVNAKFGGFGASLDGDNAGGVFGALAFPLGRNFGAQIDGLVGNGGGDVFYGIGAHLFWRDPSRGLLGAYVSHLRWDTTVINGVFDIGNTEVGKVGFEGALYLGRLSLEGIAAHQFGSQTGFAGKATMAYYLHDDFRLHLGASHLEGAGVSGFAGVEWMPSSNRGMSWFADVSVDEDHDTRAMLGLKFYFSRDDKSLIKRHREDDPDVDLPSDLYQSLRDCPVGPISGTCDGST